VNNLILFGHKNCGKTYLGERLAKELDYLFIDTDRIIEKSYPKPLSCREIYREVGEKGFRQLEERAIFSLEGMNNAVIALGGGAILFQNNCQLLQSMGTLFYLKVDKATLKKRGVYIEKNAFERIYRERTSLYEAIAAYQIDLSRLEESMILTKFKEYVHGQ
jgi:shikimate kinase